jgi:hydrogenase nickel incorporation protein HypA/HybF
MHEVAAMRGVVTTVLERIREEHGTSVSRVKLVLGASGHLTEDAARQHFAVFAQGTTAEHAQLDIEWLPASYQCFECLHRFTSAELPETVLCPRCGGLALETAHSDDCYAAEIDVESVEQVASP